MEAHIGGNLPLSEQFYTAAKDWAEKEAAADLLEQTKSAVMAQRQAMLGDLPVNRSEQIVKASPDWSEHVEVIVAARREANLAKVRMEFLRMKHAEHQSAEANQRTEARLMS